MILLALAGEPLKRIEIAAILGYREHADFRKKYTHCLYRPSCSLYGLNVLRRDGFWQGNFQLAKRLAVCSPIGYGIGKWHGSVPDGHGPAPFDSWAPEPESEATRTAVPTQPTGH